MTSLRTKLETLDHTTSQLNLCYKSTPSSLPTCMYQNEQMPQHVMLKKKRKGKCLSIIAYGFLEFNCLIY